MSAYLLELVTLFAIFATAATVVAVLIEDAGFIHVGAAAFLGVGAYTAALLAVRVGIDPQLALLATLPVGAMSGLLLHLILRRLSGDILALGTLAVGIILQGIAVNAIWLTGGPMGLAGIPARPPVLANHSFDALAMLAIVLVGVAVVRGRLFGTRVQALREDEGLAGDLELQPEALRAILWAVSSSILCLAGGFLAFHFRYVDPSSFTVRESVAILAMALILPGPKGINASIGAFIFIVLPEALRFAGLPPSSGAQLRQFIFGIALLVVIARTTTMIGRHARPGADHA